MTDLKTKKLMRDLISLHLKYGRRDFERAFKLIEAAVTEKKNTLKAKRNKSTLKTKVPAKQGKPSNHTQAFHSSQAPLTAGKPDPEFSQFCRDLLSGKLLGDQSQLAEFAKFIGLKSSPKLKRNLTATKIVEKLSAQNQADRHYLINSAKSLSSERSSLQAWTELIVRDDK